MTASVGAIYENNIHSISIEKKIILQNGASYHMGRPVTPR